MKFLNKNCLITGGTKGLGLATAKTFAQAGANLILVYRQDEAAAKAALGEIHQLQSKVRLQYPETSLQCQVLSCDMTDPGSAQKIAAFVREHFQELHHFVFNAAATSFRPLGEVELHHFQKTFSLSVWGLIALAKELTPLMPPQSSITTVSGMDTVQVVPGHGLLAAAKAAVEELTTYLAHELAAKKISVNGINPGFLETESTQIMMGSKFAAIAKNYASSTVRKEPLSLSAIAELILFLAGSGGEVMAGQTLIADGGFSKKVLLL